MSFQEQKDESKVETNLENMNKIAEEFSDARKEYHRQTQRETELAEKKAEILYQKITKYIVENRQKIDRKFLMKLDKDAM